MIGQTLSHYRVVEQIGAGGIGLFTAPMMSSSSAT